MVEVTRRCDLKCPVCFASAGEKSRDPSHENLTDVFRSIADRLPQGILQISGGEPTVRDDLCSLVTAAAAMDFAGVQLNTNGIRLAEDSDLPLRLKESGLSWVYLQFDSTEDYAYAALRGRSLFSIKRKAVERCADAELGVVLVTTVKQGVNDHLLGDILRFGSEHAPAVRGVHFQPMAFFGRYPFPPSDEERITLPEVLQRIWSQHSFFRMDDFSPCGGLHPMCSFTGEFFVSQGKFKRKGTAKPPKEELDLVRATARVASRWTLPEDTTCSGDVFGDVLSWRRRIFTVTGMAFQDAWTLDTERLQRCPIKCVGADGTFFPFCTGTVTSRNGRRLYGKNVP